MSGGGYNVAPNGGFTGRSGVLQVCVPVAEPGPLPFSPRTVPGCQLWLDGMDRSSMLPATGTAINTWNDKSIDENHLTFNLGTRAFMTSGGINLTAVSGFYVKPHLFSGHPLGSTIFIVFLEQSGVSNRHVLYSTWAGGSFMTQNDEFLYEVIGVPSRSGVPGMPRSPLKAHYSIRADSTSGRTRMKANGNEIQNSAYAASYQNFSQTFFQMTNETFEIIVYKGALSPENMVAVETYLMNKWGV